MRLNVRMFGAEELLCSVARKVLDHVSELASAVVALPGISFGILVGKHRPHSFENGFTHEIFRGNQFQAVVLTAGLVLNRGSDILVRLIQTAGRFGGRGVLTIDIVTS